MTTPLTLASFLKPGERIETQFWDEDARRYMPAKIIEVVRGPAEIEPTALVVYLTLELDNGYRYIRACSLSEAVRLIH